MNDINRSWVGITILLAACGAPFAPGETPLSNKTEVYNAPGAGDTEFKDLALRALNSTFGPFGGPPGGESHIYVGSMPPTVVADLALPEGVTVVGSIQRQFDDNNTIDIVAESTAAPDEVTRLVREKLASAGWKQPQMAPPAGGPGGFVPAETSSAPMLCKGDDGPMVNLVAQKQPDGKTELRANVSYFPKSAMSPCRGTPMPGMPEMPMQLPAIVPPVGVKLVPRGGGGGINAMSSSAALETEIPVTALSDHFVLQLEKAGWARKASSNDDVLSWSTWTYKDKQGNEQRGLFYAYNVPDAKASRVVYLEGTYGTGANLPPMFSAGGGAAKPIKITAAAGKTDADFKALALRLMSGPEMGGMEGGTQVHVAQLPDELARAIAVPAGMKVIGGTRRGPKGMGMTEGILEGKLAPEAATKAFGDALVSTGWKRVDMSAINPMGGFAPGFMPVETLCKSDAGPMINVMASEQASATELRVILHEFNDPRMSSGGPCNPQFAAREAGMQPVKLPALVSPPGMGMFPSGGGGGPDNMSSSAMFVTSQPADALHKHFAPQLEKAGWKQVKAGSDPAFAWSLWTLKDHNGKDQVGLMTVTASDGTKPMRTVTVSAGFSRP